MSAAELNEMSTVILEWLREMDKEKGPTLRESTKDYNGDVGDVVKTAFMCLNTPFLMFAPPFLQAVFTDCLKKIDWSAVASQRIAEAENE